MEVFQGPGGRFKGFWGYSTRVWWPVSFGAVFAGSGLGFEVVGGHRDSVEP